MPTPDPVLCDQIVVIGNDTTTVRLVEELIRAGDQIVVLAPEADGTRPDRVDIEAELEPLGVLVQRCGQPRQRDLLGVGIERAKAAVLLGDDDVAAVRLALLIEELAPNVRFVIEMTNFHLGSKLEQLLGECTLLSSAELAAPAFVAAALSSADTQTFEIGGRMVAVGPREQIGGDLLALIADSRLSGIKALLPENDGDIVLGTRLLGGSRAGVRRSGLVGAFGQVFDRRARLVLLGLLMLILLSTLYFHFGGSDWLTSLFLALATSTAMGSGEVDELSTGFRFGAVLIQLFGLILSSGITALIVDALISARLVAMTGGIRGKPKHHIVVCGLGRVGSAVAARLKARGLPVVAIESAEDAPGVLGARRLKIPVVIGRANDTEAQVLAGIGRADVVVAMTDDPAVNLEISLVAKSANPDVRVVTRMFDHELAERVERRLELGTTRSVSMLAAPAFAAAALGRRREVIFPVGRRVLLFTEVTVSTASTAPGRMLSELEQPGTCRVLAYSTGSDGKWRWEPEDHQLCAGDQLAVVATRAGLARLLLATKRPRTAV